MEVENAFLFAYDFACQHFLLSRIIVSAAIALYNLQFLNRSLKTEVGHHKAVRSTQIL